MLTSSYNSNTNYKQETMPISLREPPNVGNESSRYFNNNNHMDRLATSTTPSSLNNSVQLYYQPQQPSNVRFNNSHYDDNQIITSPNSTDITSKQPTDNRNTNFYQR